MNDRELLEAAAKAAGIQIEWERDPAFIQERWQAMVLCGWAGQPSQREWQPLREPGDALSLAVALRMRIKVDDYGASARIGDQGTWHGCEAHLHGGIEAATRRAIVRAAAETSRAKGGSET